MAPKGKSRKCKACGKEFTPALQAQVVCSITCACEYTKTNNEKNRVREKKELRAKLKATDIPSLKKKAQVVFNKYIRERDKDKPCISCGTTNDIQYHAGHYRPIGSAPQLRYNENNVHKQCVKCNNYSSGNLANYRLGLIKKIGLEKVEELESNHEVKKWTAVELREIIAKYK